MTIFQFHDVGGDVVVVAICSSLAGHKLSTVMDKFYMHDKHIWVINLLYIFWGHGFYSASA